MYRKRVVVGIDPNIVMYKDADTNMIYAAKAQDDGHIIIVSRVWDADRGDGYATNWLYPDQLFNHTFYDEELSGIIEQMIKSGYDVYEFESDFDLAEWIVQSYGEI